MSFGYTDHLNVTAGLRKFCGLWDIPYPKDGEFFDGTESQICFTPFGLVIRLGLAPHPLADYYHPLVLQPLAAAKLGGGRVLEILPWLDTNVQVWESLDFADRLIQATEPDWHWAHDHVARRNHGRFSCEDEDIIVLIDRGMLAENRSAKTDRGTQGKNHRFRQQADMFATRSPQAKVFTPLSKELRKACPDGLMQPPDKLKLQIFLEKCMRMANGSQRAPLTTQIPNIVRAEAPDLNRYLRATRHQFLRQAAPC